jgi:hypothetical protein
MLRKTDGTRQLVSLNDVIAQTLRLTQSDALAHDCAVLTEFYAALPKVEADVVQLQQVFLNLILNAFEASKDVPKLQRRVIIRTERAGDCAVRACVRDFGAGLPAEASERIFEQFFSTKREGMGMGLFISRSIVAAHHGTLCAENARGGAEARLYREVTDYVREEFNRAEALANDKRAGTVGFALTILQRRLASSPEAIYQSLHRRSERLQKRLRELELLQRGAAVEAIAAATPTLDADDLEDLEDASDNEVEEIEEEILDQATAARTIGELKAEIATLGRLESLALAVRRSGEDRKWRELASLLGYIFRSAAIPNDPPSDASSDGASTIPPPKPSPRQKLVVFTEHRDTLSYLETRVTTLLGRKEAVVVIHGGMGREERLKAQESFKGL